MGGETVISVISRCWLPGLSPRGRGNPVAWLRRQHEGGSIPAWAGKPGRGRGRGGGRKVYPRVGGETQIEGDACGQTAGLSPRGRGNLLLGHRGTGLLGSIPAWAGKPSGSAASTTSRRVYPRVGGETIAAAGDHAILGGLSPRGRGNPPPARAPGAGAGSIPAWAGKPATIRLLCRSWRVYPRVGGETHHRRHRLLMRQGLSPRGRGNHCCGGSPGRSVGSIPAWAGKPTIAPLRRHAIMVYPRVGGETLAGLPADPEGEGLSPRGRGNLPSPPARPDQPRSIPAWAGKPRDRDRGWERLEVYPRVGGETGRRRRAGGPEKGLSPRGRGNRDLRLAELRSEGSIPAWAGKPGSGSGSGSGSGVYPRVGGETLRSATDRLRRQGLSPRGRGNPLLLSALGGVRRSIPAWAGKPRPPLRDGLRHRVYPRVGGETPAAATAARRTAGLSPRGRGNHMQPYAVCRYIRSIPAWAGKPLRHSDSFVCICQRSLVLLGRYGGSPAMCRIRFHTSLASGSAR